MRKADLNEEQQKELEAYCGNDQCVLIGYVSDIKDKRFNAIFDRTKQESLVLEEKTKRLNIKQRTNLEIGRIVKLDFNDGKLYFMDSDKTWF